MQTTCRLNCWWRQQVQKNQWFAGGLNINAWDHWAVSPTKKEPGDQPHPTTDPRLVCCSIWWPSERCKATPVLVRSSSQHVPDSRNQNAHVVNGFDWLRWLPSGCGLGWQPVPASHWWVRGHKLRVPGHACQFYKAVNLTCDWHVYPCQPILALTYQGERSPKWWCLSQCMYAAFYRWE